MENGALDKKRMLLDTVLREGEDVGEAPHTNKDGAVASGTDRYLRESGDDELQVVKSP